MKAEITMRDLHTERLELSPREEMLLEMYLGGKNTFKKIGEEFDVPGERIRQIVNRAMLKLFKKYRLE